jgi:hypothetical protein
MRNIVKRICFLAFGLATSLHSTAQITIDNGDMPTAGDKKRVSIGQIVPGINFTATGANHLWDFSNLQWISQDVDTFLSIGQTGISYQIFFANIPGNPNRANVATKSTLQAPPVGGINISDVLAFFYNSTSSYKQVGYGAGINGFPTPIPFNNHDLIYQFPLNFNNLDSSYSDFSLGIPGLGYYGYSQKRVNICDGWGTLITPFGQFDVLRVRSIISGRDTIYLDTLGFGFGFNRPVMREYKWLGKNHDIPLLQINTTVGFGGTETINLIRYQDSLRVLSVDDPAYPATMTIYPNPAGEILNLDLTVQQQDEYKIQLISADGKQVAEIFNGVLKPGMQSFKIIPKVIGLSSGVYLLQTESSRTKVIERVIIQ